MKANEIISITKRARKSRLAEQMKDFEFEYQITKVTVSENAPCSLQKDGTTPEKEGWIEIIGELKFAGNPYTPSEIWIKNATLGGKRREWVRSAN